MHLYGLLHNSIILNLFLNYLFKVLYISHIYISIYLFAYLIGNKCNQLSIPPKGEFLICYIPTPTQIPYMFYTRREPIFPTALYPQRTKSPICSIARSDQSSFMLYS